MGSLDYFGEVAEIRHPSVFVTVCVSVIESVVIGRFSVKSWL